LAVSYLLREGEINQNLVIRKTPIVRHGSWTPKKSKQSNMREREETRKPGNGDGNMCFVAQKISVDGKKEDEPFL